MKKLFSLILASVLCLSLATPALAAGLFEKGECSDSVNWTLDSDGVLVISGTGAMPDYANKDGSRAPWYKYLGKIKAVSVLSGITDIGSYSFSECNLVTKATLGDGVRVIGDRAFSGCTALASVSIPASVTTIGNNAFTGCALSSVNIPSGVTTIGQGAFQECAKLASAEIPASVTAIGEYAFLSCTSLKSMRIPYGITNVPGGLFQNCSALNSVSIPGTVTVVSLNAFDGCSSLSNVYYGGVEAKWKEISFTGGNSKLQNATIIFNNVAANGLQVQRTNQRLTVNGVEQTTEIYNIGGANYFKLRDIAAMLNGTSAQFSVDYDSVNRIILVQTGKSYQKQDSDLKIGEDKSSTCQISSQPLKINNLQVELSAYNLGGSNFFGLRDLGAKLGFNVDYDNATRTMLVTTK